MSEWFRLRLPDAESPKLTDDSFFVTYGRLFFVVVFLFLSFSYSLGVDVVFLYVYFFFIHPSLFFSQMSYFLFLFSLP